MSPRYVNRGSWPLDGATALVALATDRRGSAITSTERLRSRAPRLHRAELSVACGRQILQAARRVRARANEHAFGNY